MEGDALCPFIDRFVTGNLDDTLPHSNSTEDRLCHWEEVFRMLYRHDRVISEGKPERGQTETLYLGYILTAICVRNRILTRFPLLQLGPVLAPSRKITVSQPGWLISSFLVFFATSQALSTTFLGVLLRNVY